MFGVGILFVVNVKKYLWNVIWDKININVMFIEVYLLLIVCMV